MKFIDFFSGIGGIRLGLEMAGHKCVGFCEWDHHARQSYKAMYNTEGGFESHDVRTINAGDLPRADCWCFGFPCQDISVAGKQAGLEAGERSGLFFEIMRLLAGTQEKDKPKWLLAENVKNLLSVGNGFDFLRLLVEMDAAGYDVEWQLFNSKDYGVPQNRERVFIVGRLRGTGGGGQQVFPISPTDGENTVKLSQIGSTVYSANPTYSNHSSGRVYDVEGLSPALRTTSGGGHEPLIVDDQGRRSKKLEPTDIVPTLRAQDHGNPPKVIYIPIIMGRKYIDGQRRQTFVVNTKGPMNCVTCKCGDSTANIDGLNAILISEINGGNIKDDNVKIRKLTPREYWRLQGFPDEYFDKAKAAGVSNSQLYKQAGNAVTVSVAYAIGKKMWEMEEE